MIILQIKQPRIFVRGFMIELARQKSIELNGERIKGKLERNYNLQPRILVRGLKEIVLMIIQVTQPRTLVRGLMISEVEQTQGKKKTIDVSIEENSAMNAS